MAEQPFQGFGARYDRKQQRQFLVPMTWLSSLRWRSTHLFNHLLENFRGWQGLDSQLLQNLTLRRAILWGVKSGFALVLGLFILCAWPFSSWAAEDAGVGIAAEATPTSPIKPQPDAGDIPSETVSKFVQAYLAVVDLISQRETDLQRVETETESIQLQERIQAEAFQLIERAGITQQEYWQLLGLANTDPDFRERVLAQVEETNL
ncbi:MAG TPA: DUF4168 domain-containing protein [Trichocoleus sp.]